MFCSNCGHPLLEGAAFCTQCGAAVAPAKPQQAEGTQPVPAGMNGPIEQGEMPPAVLAAEPIPVQGRRKGNHRKKYILLFSALGAVVVAAAVLLLLLLPGAPEPVVRGVHWGMSADEIRQSETKFADTEEGDLFEGDLFYKYALQYDLPCTIVYRFDDAGGLNTVGIFFNIANDANYQHLLTELVDQYGTSGAPNVGSSDYQHLWYHDGTCISMVYVPEGGSGENSLGILFVPEDMV